MIAEPASSGKGRVFVLGATGSIGAAVVRALLRRGREVACLVRPGSDPARLPPLAGADVRFGEAADPASLARDGLRGERFGALVSCMASRTGSPADAWAVDHLAHRHALAAARAAGVSHFVLLSAICVQKPRLAFQHAKLAFEKELAASGMRWSIVRPTAYFKSLSGQLERVRRGRPYLLFGDGRLTACKPIADEDLADYMADCLQDETRWNRVLPIGGPGPAITPREQGERLFALLGRPPRFRSLPVGAMDAVVGALSLAGRVSPAIAAKAELARIGRYYATESMLVLDPSTGRYDADATPSTGVRTLFDAYADMVAGAPPPDLGDHAVFGRRRGDGA